MDSYSPYMKEKCPVLLDKTGHFQKIINNLLL